MFSWGNQRVSGLDGLTLANDRFVLKRASSSTSMMNLLGTDGRLCAFAKRSGRTARAALASKRGIRAHRALVIVLKSGVIQRMLGLYLQEDGG